MFNGADYNPMRDDPRLTSQLERIKTLMLDGKWRTLNEIARITGSPEPSVSAQLRHLRKPKHGQYSVEKEYVGDGLFRYQVLPRN